MAPVSTVQLPRCGLYRTTRAIGDDVPARSLVNFHRRSGACSEGSSDDLGSPSGVIYLPMFSTHNRWQWEKKGIPIRERSDVETLHPLPPEGYYRLREEMRFEDAKWPVGSLVQLGYERRGTPLLFLAQRRFHLAENTLFFADRGMPVDGTDMLERLLRSGGLEPLVVHEEPDPNALGAEAPVIR